jgi:DNA processing protein
MSRRTQVPPPDREALGWLGLGLAVEVPPRRARALVERLGTADAVLKASAGELEASGATPAQAAALRRAGARVAAEARRLVAVGAEVRCWPSPAYPALLRQIPDPPAVLALRGTLAPEEPCIAVVGARRASEYGRRVAAELARGLAQAGVTVVSGLAAGIDAAAHRAALEAGGRTVAVLGTGIDRTYPSWHAGLAAAIAGQGALVSEFPCGTPPLAFNFPRRNRLISGLSLGTVVVEAAEESGSLITARYAVDQNRDVFAVPGPLGVAAHHGPHRLIREGARLVTRVEDILSELAPALVDRLAARRRDAVAATLTDAERTLLEAIGADGRHVDEVIRRADVPAGPALETLLALELRGLVHQLPGKRFRRAA